jgi:CzcA family heavy metal efflux pump
MWIVQLALRRPLTFIVMALVIVLIVPLVLVRTPTDIFPEINIPVVSVVWGYTGMQPTEIADRITLPSERSLTTLVNDVEHIESQSLNGTAVIKVFFRPNVNLQGAIAQVTAISQTILRALPPGVTPPLVVTYSASTIPIVQLGMSGGTLSEQRLYDLGQNFLRTALATVPGAEIPFPYGGKQRQITVDLDLPALQARGLTPVDVVNAVNAQNLILPSGTAKVGALEYTVEMNGTPQTVAELNNLPVRTQNGATIYLRDVGFVRDGYSPQTNIVRQDGKRAALMSVYKNGGASTLTIVHDVLTTLPRALQSLPPEFKVTPLFDQSLFVRAAVQGVVREGLIAACLTAVMILLFLGDWRSTFIIAISIPLSIFVSLIALSALGQTINLMTLGGLALAVGILVDDATVAIENIDRHRAMGKELVPAILDGSQEIAVPALVSTFCICIVFVPMFFLTGVARYLFVPMAEAVVFAMIASYVLSRTLVPTLVMYLMRGQEHGKKGDGALSRFQKLFEDGFERFRASYRSLLESTLQQRKGFALVFLLLCVASLGLAPFLGRDFFPSVDAGQFRLHVRAPAGLRIEETARLCDRIEQAIRAEMPGKEVRTILDNIGLPYSGLNLSYSNAGTIGTGDAEILVELGPNRRRGTADYVRQLREALPRQFPGVEFFFQPSDIVTQILNFGLPAPIDIQVVGQNLSANYAIAQQIANRLRHVPGAVDVHVHQMMNGPTLHLEIDRTRVQQVGLSAADVAQNVLVSLSSSFQTAPMFWLDPKNEVVYNLALQTPQYRVDSLPALMNTPVSNSAAPAPQVLGNLVQLTPVARPVVVSHYEVQPVIDVYATVQDRDLGGVAAGTDRILSAFQDHLPRGTHLTVRGQVETMRSSFIGLGAGLVIAIALVYFLIVVNFQSWLDPFIIITALPGALAGIAWMLLLSHTTLSVPSLTGAVMCMGVATANSILLVTFARGRLDAGVPAVAAALEAGTTRIRPVLMTALAMIIGMVPMALGLGEGGEQNAPLGRAVIGGLIFATVATLFFVPAVFAILHGRHSEQPSAE